ncbi:alpha-L-fucosidase, partial [Klebsiella pneumoniae]|nr:alpha-L-fucosidase [Klebsiella pneumoniae]
YEWPTDPSVLEKIEKWQDAKLGIMFHWGIYSVPGIAESWALCSEDRWFTDRRREARPETTYCEFKKWYWGLSESFKPSRFEPTEWATFMKKVG